MSRKCVYMKGWEFGGLYWNSADHPCHWCSFKHFLIWPLVSNFCLKMPISSHYRVGSSMNLSKAEFWLNFISFLNRSQNNQHFEGLSWHVSKVFENESSVLPVSLYLPSSFISWEFTLFMVCTVSSVLWPLPIFLIYPHLYKCKSSVLFQGCIPMLTPPKGFALTSSPLKALFYFLKNLYL